MGEDALSLATSSDREFHDPLGTNNLLHRYPALYDRIYERSAAGACREIVTAHLKTPPTSVLDIGCGTGRDVSELAQSYTGCVGVDMLPSMIEYASAIHPEVAYEVGDMREFRLGRPFDMVLALGNSLNYMLTNHDLRRAMTTIAVHCQPGALLVVEPFDTGRIANARWPTTFSVEAEGVTANAHATYEWDAVTQILSRRRDWTITDLAGEHDYVDWFHLRLLFTQELS